VALSVAIHGCKAKSAVEVNRVLGAHAARHSHGMFPSQFLERALKELSTSLCHVDAHIEHTVAGCL
jgi:hypothetical protein